MQDALHIFLYSVGRYSRTASASSILMTVISRQQSSSGKNIHVKPGMPCHGAPPYRSQRSSLPLCKHVTDFMSEHKPLMQTPSDGTPGINRYSVFLSFERRKTCFRIVYRLGISLHKRTEPFEDGNLPFIDRTIFARPDVQQQISAHRNTVGKNAEYLR